MAGLGQGPCGKEAGSRDSEETVELCRGPSCQFFGRGTDRTSPFGSINAFPTAAPRERTPPLGLQRLPSATPTLQRSSCHRNDQAASGFTATELGLVCKASSKRWQKGWLSCALERVALGTLCPGPDEMHGLLQAGQERRFTCRFTGLPSVAGIGPAPDLGRRQS